MSRLSGLGKPKMIANRQQRVGNGRPENKNLLVASGCFDMILMGFMSENIPL
jgi:hypothetical protein